MKKMLLTSNGLSHPEIIKEFLKLVNKPATQIKVIFVPTASTKNKYYQKSEINCLAKLGIKKQNIKLIKLNHKILYKEVKSFDIIYVIGGNTFYLLHRIKETGFDKVIKKFLERSGAYFGVSAGSYISCPTIEAAGWKPVDRNIIRLKNLTALNIIPFLITAHYKPKYKSIIKKAINNSKYPVKILADNQAILITGKKIKLIGKGTEIKV